MSPRKLRKCRLIETSVTTRKKAKMSTLKSRDTKSLSDTEEIGKNKEKTYTSNRLTMIKCHKAKPNKSIVDNDSILDIDNMSCLQLDELSGSAITNSEEKSMHDISLNETTTPKRNHISTSSTPQSTTRSSISNSPPRFNILNTLSRKKKKASLKSNTSSENLKLTVQRLSNSPKISLQSPKSNTKRKSLKMKLSNGKSKTFNVSKVQRSQNKSISQKASKFSSKRNRDHLSSSSGVSDLEVTLTSENNLPSLYKEIISNQPRVILERIPLLDNLSQSPNTQRNQHPMDNTFDTKEDVQTQLFKNANSSNFIGLSTPHVRSRSLLSNDVLPQLSPKATSSPISHNRMHENSIGLNSTNDKNISSDSNKNNTITIKDNEAITADVTYELAEPKTPCLRERCRARRTMETDTINRKKVKKVCKVQFTVPEPEVNELETTIVKSTPSTPAPTIKPFARNVAIRKTPSTKHISRKRSSSISNGFANKSTPKPEFKRSSSSMVNVNVTPYSDRSVKRTPNSMIDKWRTIGSQEKQDVKPHSAKKMPNFAEIHKKMFSKLESLIDNKKRVIKQHELLKAHTPKLNTSKIVSTLMLKKRNTVAPTEARRDGCNRFGFKVRKAEATNIVLRKQQKLPLSYQMERREENRAFLKGVRTNRRFELQMKLRKILTK